MPDFFKKLRSCFPCLSRHSLVRQQNSIPFWGAADRHKGGSKPLPDTFLLKPPIRQKLPVLGINPLIWFSINTGFRTIKKPPENHFSSGLR
jgi:hypothetical protein